ncbi:hypothetical protein PCH70_26430 [Pseudomonas cichorii JBC1]|nr:hypothetical protein PCH70_26430 [Pseudomonas cichorii JBC1]
MDEAMSDHLYRAVSEGSSTGGGQPGCNADITHRRDES